MTETVIIDTNCANLASVKYALNRLTDKVYISADPEVIGNAKRLILPGVGTARSGMKNLHSKDLVKTIKQISQPVLGICLGMQLLCRHSQEANCDCLAVIDTDVKLLETNELPLPHMGWNTISPIDHPLFYGVSNEQYVYFVHSYHASISDNTIATCQYGQTFSAAIAYNNFMGVQFHPEKSAATGQQILKNFLEMK